MPAQFPTAVPVNVFNKMLTHCCDVCLTSSSVRSGTWVRAGRARLAAKNSGAPARDASA